MKKQIILLGMMLTAAFTLTSCVQEIDNPVQEPEAGIPFEITASISETKTVNDGMKTKWEENDRIYLFHAVAGETTYVYDYLFTVDNVESGHSTGTLREELDPQKNYDWYAFYANSISGSPSASPSGCRLDVGGGVTQNGYDDMTALRGSRCPLYGVVKSLPAGKSPEFEMSHLSSVVAINVTNATESVLVVNTASLTAEENIAGKFSIDVTGDSVIYNDYDARNTATVTVASRATVLLKGESAVLYLTIKPFTASAGEKLTLSVNGYEKTLTMTKDVTFSAGKIKTLNFSYDRVVNVDEALLEAELVKCWENQYNVAGAWQNLLHNYIGFASCLIAWKDNRLSDSNYTQCFNLTFDADNSLNAYLYKFFYNAVTACNNLMDLMNTNTVEQSFRNEVEGEVRFIRGWMYFCLTRYYGDVPMILERTAAASETDSPRMSYHKVYKQVLEDLEFAEKNMRSSDRQAAVAGGYLCRPHKWAATAMKALVYTQIACLIENKDYQFFNLSKTGREPDFTFAGIASAADAWNKALTTAESVINCGEYALASDYADLFDWGRDKPVYQNKERILVLQNGNTTGFTNTTALYTLPPYWNGTARNSNHGRYRPSRFPVVKWCRVHGGETYSTDGLTGLFSSCYDPRFDVSYIYNVYENKSTEKNQKIYPQNLTHSTYYLPYFKKYSDPEYDCTPGYADMYIIRLAEMYLIAAEACASLSSGPGDASWNKALEYMEVLHARARNSDATHATSPSMSNWTLNTKEDLVNAIMWERVFELHGEGNHEFFDTHRRGGKWMAEWLTKPLNAFHEESEQTYGTSYTYFSRYFDNTILPEDPQALRKALLIPIPTRHDLPENDFHL